MWGKAAHDADGHGAVECGGRSLPADVAERDAKLLRTVPQEIIKVAANFARREVPRGNVEAIIISGNGAKECALNTLGGLKVP